MFTAAAAEDDDDDDAKVRQRRRVVACQCDIAIDEVAYKGRADIDVMRTHN